MMHEQCSRQLVTCTVNPGQDTLLALTAYEVGLLDKYAHGMLTKKQVFILLKETKN